MTRSEAEKIVMEAAHVGTQLMANWVDKARTMEALAILSTPEPRPEGVPDVVYIKASPGTMAKIARRDSVAAWGDMDGATRPHYRYRFDGIVETGERGENG